MFYPDILHCFISVLPIVEQTDSCDGWGLGDKAPRNGGLGQSPQKLNRF